MTYQELREWVDANPFAPFRIVITDGRAFEITHPNMLRPGRHSAMVGLPDDPAEPDVPGRHVTLALLHIVRCEPTGPSATVPAVPTP